MYAKAIFYIFQHRAGRRSFFEDRFSSSALNEKTCLQGFEFSVRYVDEPSESVSEKKSYALRPYKNNFKKPIDENNLMCYSTMARLVFRPFFYALKISKIKQKIH